MAKSAAFAGKILRKAGVLDKSATFAANNAGKPQIKPQNLKIWPLIAALAISHTAKLENLDNPSRITADFALFVQISGELNRSRIMGLNKVGGSTKWG